MKNLTLQELQDLEKEYEDSAYTNKSLCMIEKEIFYSLIEMAKKTLEGKDNGQEN